MKISTILVVISIVTSVGIVFATPLTSSALAHSTKGTITYCHNEKSGTNVEGPCPGKSVEHNKNLVEKTCVLPNCPPNLKHKH